VLRGDDEPIQIREGTNVLDNLIYHEGVSMGPYATVGLGAVSPHYTVGQRALVGMNIVVLDGSPIHDQAIVAAGSVVTEDTEIPSLSLAAGTPASVIREDVSDSAWEAAADRYVARSTPSRATAETLAERE